MKKVRFYHSLRFRFVLICVLLVFIAMQIISLYFVRQLEENMVSNFKESVSDRANLWSHTIQTEMQNSQNENNGNLDTRIELLLDEYVTGDVLQIVVFNQSRSIIATGKTRSDIGDIFVDMDMIDRLLSVDQVENREVINEANNRRIWLSVVPVTDESKNLLGFVYIASDIERIYIQVKEIYTILQRGTLFSLIVTAVIGLIISIVFTRPISAMRRLAIDLSKGKYTVEELNNENNDEIGLLADSINMLSKKLQIAQNKMESEKQRLASILMNMSDGVIATDEHGKIILINMQALKMLNIDDEKNVINSSIISLLNIEKDYNLEDLMEKNMSIILDYSDNTVKCFFKAYFTVVRDESNLPEGIVTVLHDITEQERIEEERKEFVANVSHEIRTPLTTIRSYLEALSDGTALSQDLESKFLIIIQSETNRMIRLVNELLNFSKLEGGQTPMMVTWTDFVHFFSKIIERFELYKEKNIIFVKNFPDFPVYVEIDCDKIIQVIDNIISNALKYSMEHGKIYFGLQVFSNYIEISIRDEGAGMPKGNAEKIFERFYRVDKSRSRRQGGSGLGLAIAKEIITMHNGEIYARSIEGVGTTLIFTLPFEGRIEGDEWS